MPTTTVAQEYIKEHGPAPTVSDLPAESTADAIVHWDGRGKLARYQQLEAKQTQKYRLFGEECVVVGCKRTIDTPKYIMELVGAPMCTECAQKVALQQTKGEGPHPFKPESVLSILPIIVTFAVAGSKNLPPRISKRQKPPAYRCRAGTLSLPTTMTEIDVY